jgi:hypothetical protein
VEIAAGSAESRDMGRAARIAVGLRTIADHDVSYDQWLGQIVAGCITLPQGGS